MTRSQFIKFLIYVVIIGTLAAFLIPVVTIAQSQDEEPPQAEDDTPLVVTVRPRPRADETGFYVGAALELDNGLIVEFTGWFIPKEVIEAMTGDAPTDFNIENFVRALGTEGQEPVRAQDIWLVEIPDVGIIIGKEYQGMGLVEIASLMDVDLSKPATSVSNQRGFYAPADLFAVNTLAARVLGSVNFDYDTIDQD